MYRSAYLTALTMKGETIDEITGSAEEMRNHAVQLSHERRCTGDRRNRRGQIRFF